MRTPKLIMTVAAPLLALATSAHAADVGVLSQASALLAEPKPKAAQVAKLPANAPITVVERQGGWYHVKGPAGEDGWVKLMAVRLAARPGATPAQGSSSAAEAALRGGQGGSAGGATAAALGSMMTGSSADSTAVRGGAGGKMSGQQMVDPSKAEHGTVQKVEELEPSDKDMEDFEKGLDDE